MNPKKGSILLYTLCILLSFLSWFQALVIQRARVTQKRYYINLVQERLDIQDEVLNYYRNNCLPVTDEDIDYEEDEFEDFDDEDFEWEVDDDLNLEACEFNFDYNDKQVYTQRYEDVITVVIGDSEYVMKYDIISDGSVIQTITEE